MNKLRRLYTSARLRIERDWRIAKLNQQVRANAQPDPTQRPVAMFNASARLGSFSQNAAFALLTSWGLQLAGLPVVHFVCQAGMQRCVLGTDRDDHLAAPPCDSCMALSQRLYQAAPVYGFTYAERADLAKALDGLSLSEMLAFEYEIADLGVMPLGELVITALRWSLRRHNLLDDEATRFLLRSFVLSAYRAAEEFRAFL